MSIFLSEEAFYIIRRIQKNNTLCFVYENENENEDEDEDEYQNKNIVIGTRDLWIIIYKQKEYHYLHYFLEEKEEDIMFPKYHLREYGLFSQMSPEIRKILNFITTKENISQIHVNPILSFLSKPSNLLE